MARETAEKAEISDFEKKEVKKILDSIVGEAMGEKKTTSVAKKTSVKKPSGKRMDFAKKTTAKKTAKKSVTKVTTTKVSVAVKKPAPKKVVKKETPKQPPLVSVILPVHNGERYIDSTIHSVLGQTFQDFELIIVDDASEDRTLGVVKEFASDKIIVVTLPEKSGMAKARNAGVDKASGRYVCFLNARDMWQPDKLAQQVEFVQSKNLAFSYTGYVFADENGMPFGKVVKVPTEISNTSKVSAIWVSTVMLDLDKLSKEDILMPDVKNAKTATWEKVLKKVGTAQGLNEVLAIRACDHKTSLWGKMWRRG